MLYGYIYRKINDIRKSIVSDSHPSINEVAGLEMNNFKNDSK